MAECPGVLHLAEMADGGLARLRVPGGALTAAQLRAVANAAGRLGSGAIDLTNRANLQIRGLSHGGGGALAGLLADAGFAFHGEADRRRNVLVDPLSGIDPDEIRDLRPLARALDAALVAADWIGGLSPKFSFVLDGGGASGVAAVASDVTVLAQRDGLAIEAGRLRAHCSSEAAALAALVSIAELAARSGPDARASGLSESDVAAALEFAGPAMPLDVGARARRLSPLHGVVASRTGIDAIVLAVPVGRLDAGMMRFLAGASETEGEGVATLAPWSAVVLPGVGGRAPAVMARAEAVGFVPVAVAERLSVTACSGAPACVKAREAAKDLGADVLRLAAERRELLPPGARSLHLSACPKGCAGSAPADLLLLGSGDRDGWAVHAGGAPRAPGPSLERIERADPVDLLRRLAG
ncbi:hypothetical protein [Methylopila sp. M107]|uniref:hypothetical protein n=1 Tax=Methylopila sp. M107 TaxID=1101190 RepID=UPI0003781BA9|nr:hypothetical protein [Methylopila sp. M107]